jgi:TonB family protein
VCGNGSIEVGEQCDDGNTSDGDGCASTCRIEIAPRATAVCGNGTVEAGEQCDDGNTAGGDGCSSVCRTEPKVVASNDLKGLRISGETQLDPSEEVQNLMVRADVSSVRGVVRLCIATTGSVTEAKMLTSTGYEAYDQKLLAAVRDWRYHPYTVHGTPKPACSTVDFIYQIK